MFETYINYSGEASPTFGHANANFSVFIDRMRNQFKEMNDDNDLNFHLHDQIQAGFATD